jgi:hypothetical protein
MKIIELKEIKVDFNNNTIKITSESVVIKGSTIN